MANYANLIEHQVLIGEEIAKKRTNFKKEKKERLNDIEYVKRWEKRLTDKWTEFVTGHNELLKHAEELKDQPYFARKYYREISDIYNEVKRSILGLEVMRNHNASTSNEVAQGDQGTVNPIATDQEPEESATETPVTEDVETNSTSDNDVELIDDEPETFPNYIENRDNLKSKALQNIQRYDAAT